MNIQKLYVIIYGCGEEWYGHCIDADIITRAESAEQAERYIIDLVKAQIQYACDNDNYPHIFSPPRFNLTKGDCEYFEIHILYSIWTHTEGFSPMKTSLVWNEVKDE